MCYGPNGEAVATQPRFTHFTGATLGVLPLDYYHYYYHYYNYNTYYYYYYYYYNYYYYNHNNNYCYIRCSNY
nr:hypothetical protein BaRGS_016863 [Batillaria attramentaria]